MARAGAMRHVGLGVLVVAAVTALACATSAPAGPAQGASSAGERLYRSHCGACHRLRDPSEKTAAEWAAALEKYGPRAHLDPQDRPAVLEYLAQRAK